MAEVVVDLLEPVDVKVDHAHGDAPAGQFADILYVAVPVVKRGQRVLIAQFGEQFLVLVPAYRQHQEVTEGLEEGRRVLQLLLGRVVQPDEAVQLSVAIQRHKDGALDPLSGKDFVSLHRRPLEVFHIVDEQVFLLVEHVEPYGEISLRKVLQVMDLRPHALRAPFGRIGKSLAMKLENIGAPRRKQLPHLFQHVPGGLRHIMVAVEFPEALHQYPVALQTAPHLFLFVGRLGDVEGDLHPRHAAFPFHEAVFEQVMPLGDGICKFPCVRFIRLHERDIAERARRVAPLQCLIAFHAPPLVKVERLFPHVVDEQQLIGIYVGYVHQFRYLVHGDEQLLGQPRQVRALPVVLFLGFFKPLPPFFVIEGRQRAEARQKDEGQVHVEQGVLGVLHAFFREEFGRQNRTVRQGEVFLAQPQQGIPGAAVPVADDFGFDLRPFFLHLPQQRLKFRAWQLDQVKPAAAVGKGGQDPVEPCAQRIVGKMVQLFFDQPLRGPADDPGVVDDAGVALQAFDEIDRKHPGQQQCDTQKRGDGFPLQRRQDPLHRYFSPGSVPIMCAYAFFPPP